jgi:hypothetical protein
VHVLPRLVNLTKIQARRDHLDLLLMRQGQPAASSDSPLGTEGLRGQLVEQERVWATRSKLEENMSKEHDEQAELEAAKERLKRFCKRASECKNYHDPERLKAAKEGREYVPRANGWAWIARRYRTV